MAQAVITNAKIHVAGYDLSADFNQVAVAIAAEELDDTAFGDSTRTTRGGLKTGAVEASGFWNGGANTDAAVFSRIGTSNVPLFVAGEGGAAGSACYFMQAMKASLNQGGSIGEILSYGLSAKASGGTPVIRGTVLYNGTASSTSDGTGYQVGAVASGQYIYGGIWIIGDPAGTSPTLDVIVESDAADDFASATTRITFAQQTARGAVFATPVAGAITDDWWRVSITIGGTSSPSFALVAAIGII